MATFNTARLPGGGSGFYMPQGIDPGLLSTFGQNLGFMGTSAGAEAANNPFGGGQLVQLMQQVDQLGLAPEQRTELMRSIGGISTPQEAIDLGNLFLQDSGGSPFGQAPPNTPLPSGPAAQAAPARAPAPAPVQRTPLPSIPPPPPPPPRPQQVGFTPTTWSDVAPSLLDLGQLRGMFAPDAGVMAGFDSMLSGIESDVQAGRTEVDRQRDFGVGQVDTLPAEYQRIFGGVNDMLQGTVDSGNAAMQAAGQGGAETFHANPLGAASKLIQGGFEAGVPLLKAGFGEQAQKQHGFLTQMGSEMSRDVEGRKTGYLADVDAAGDSAVATGMGQNTSATNQANQFNASNQSQVDQFNASNQLQVDTLNAQALNAWNAGNYDAAIALHGQATAAAGRSLDLATKGFGPNMSLEEIAAQARSQIETPEMPKSIMDLARDYAPGQAEMSSERGKHLGATDYGLDQLHPNARGTYDKVVEELLKTDQADWNSKLASKTDWHKHPRAVSLAMLAAGGPLNIERLAGLG